MFFCPFFYLSLFATAKLMKVFYRFLFEFLSQNLFFLMWCTLWEKHANKHTERCPWIEPDDPEAFKDFLFFDQWNHRLSPARQVVQHLDRWDKWIFSPRRYIYKILSLLTILSAFHWIKQFSIHKIHQLIHWQKVCSFQVFK